MEEAVDEADSSKQSPPKQRVLPQYAAAATVNMTGFMYGSAMGWATTALPALKSDTTLLSGGVISEDDATWLASLIFLTGLFSTPVVMLLNTSVPRKTVGYLIAITYFISWLLVAFTNSLFLLYLARILVGVGAGGMLVLVPLYVSEIARDDIRGALGCFLLLFLNAGILFAYFIGLYMTYYQMAYINLSLPIIFLIIFFFLPETPFYLLSHGKPSEATASLQWLRGKEADITQELNSLKMFLNNSRTDDPKPSLWTLFSSRGAMRALIIAVVLCMNQQLSGILAVLNFTVEIFQESGSSISPTAATIIVGLLQLIATYVSCILIERLGRRILLLGSDITTSFVLAILGLYFYLRELGSDVSAFSWLPLVCLSVFVVSVSIGIGPVPYVVMSEIFSPKIKVFATAIACSAVWITAFLVVKFFNPLSDVLGVHGCYWIFSLCASIGTVFIIFVVPETKGRSLELILHELNGGQTERKRSKPKSEIM